MFVHSFFKFSICIFSICNLMPNRKCNQSFFEQLFSSDSVENRIFLCCACTSGNALSYTLHPTKTILFRLRFKSIDDEEIETNESSSEAGSLRNSKSRIVTYLLFIFKIHFYLGFRLIHFFRQFFFSLFLPKSHDRLYFNNSKSVQRSTLSGIVDSMNVLHCAALIQIHFFRTFYFCLFDL